MPPKKRAKPSTPHASTPSKTPTKDLPPSGSGGASTTTAATAARNAAAAAASANSSSSINVLNDPWTDDQETSLFKNLIRWKPTGLHKHMHMIQIASSMTREGFSYQVVQQQQLGNSFSVATTTHGHNNTNNVNNHAHHTRIPGIWKKLQELYDLEALDERENAHALAAWPDVADRGFAPPKSHYKRRGSDVEMGDAAPSVEQEEEEESEEEDSADDASEADDGPWFQLPDDEFAQLMWDRRIANAGTGGAGGGGGSGVQDMEMVESDGPERSMRGGSRRKPSPRVIVVGRNDNNKRSESPPACPELLPKVGDPAPMTTEGHDAEPAENTPDEARSHAGSPAGGGRGTKGSAAKGGMRAAAAARSRRGRNAKTQSADPEDEDDDEEQEEESSEEEDEGETPPAKDGGRGAASRSSGRRSAAAKGSTSKRTSGRKK